AAHRSKREIRVTVAHEQRGYQRVKRAFAGLQMIGMLLVERKEGAAVLQDDPGVAADHGAAKVVIDRLDQRGDHSVLVGSAEVAGVAVRRSSLMRLRVGDTRRDFGNVECML